MSGGQPDAVVAHYVGQQQVAERVTVAVRRLWAELDPSRLSESWLALRDRVFGQVAVGQFVAAGQADPYLDAVLGELGLDADRAGTVSARNFAGVAADGRSLETLLLEPLIAVKVAIAQGSAVGEGLRVGEARLVRIVRTEVADAGRTAVGAGMVARPAVTRWTRYLNPPSCSRCVVLAGKVFRWNQGFARHPLCDCVHAPSSEVFAGELTTDPRTYFDSLSPADQDRYFTKAGAETIRDGGDVGQVVNARRKASGLYQADGKQYTTEGTTKRGVAGKRAPGVARQMPETIFDGASDRAAALSELRRFGYIV